MLLPKSNSKSWSSNKRIYFPHEKSPYGTTGTTCIKKNNPNKTVLLPHPTSSTFKIIGNNHAKISSALNKNKKELFSLTSRVATINNRVTETKKLVQTAASLHFTSGPTLQLHAFCGQWVACCASGQRFSHQKLVYETEAEQLEWQLHVPEPSDGEVDQPADEVCWGL